jgi:hypothetical protein
MEKQCCKDSVARGMDFCLQCGAPLQTDETTLVRPQSSSKSSKLWYLTMIVAVLALGVVWLLVGYFIEGSNSQPAVIPKPSPAYVAASSPITSSTLTPSPKPSPSEKPTAGEVDPLTEVVRSLQKATPTDDPYLVPKSTPTPTPRPTPRPQPRVESLVYANDVLMVYGPSSDSRRYRFHLSERARIKGDFSARGNVDVEIVSNGSVIYYSSNGEIASDSIETTLPAGTYEMVVSLSTKGVVGFSAHLSAFYDQ